MPTLKELEAERKERMRKLAMLVDRKQRYLNYHQGQEQAEIGEINRARREGNLNYGDEALMGATTGLAVSGGNPYGAAIGAGVGALSGGYKAYQQRKKEGEGRGEAILNTITDLPRMIPSMDTALGVAPSLTASYLGHQSRNQPAATDTLKQLTPEQMDIKERYHQGVAETTPGDPYEDLWRWEESRKRKAQ